MTHNHYPCMLCGGYITVASIQIKLRVFNFLCNYIIRYVIVGSRFSDRVHYNEFVESGSKSWALIRRRLVLGVKNTQNQAAQRLRKKGPLARGWESPTPFTPQKPLSVLWASLSFLAVLLALGDLCCYIFLSSIYPPPTLVSHPCLSSSARPIGHSFWRSMSCGGPHRPV